MNPTHKVTSEALWEILAVATMLHATQDLSKPEIKTPHMLLLDAVLDYCNSQVVAFREVLPQVMAALPGDFGNQTPEVQATMLQGVMG